MSRRLWLLVLFATVALTGCKKAASIKTYPVTGTVTYKDKPVAGATVAYVNSSSPHPARCTGVTDPEGRFSLATYAGGSEVLKGAPAGDYQVTIVKTDSPAAAPAGGGGGNPMDSMSDAERAQAITKMWQQQRVGETRPKDQKPKSEIPERYAMPETSKLVATVVSGENDPREFKLTDE